MGRNPCCAYSARARQCQATRASIGVVLDALRQIDTHLVGQGSDPGNDVTKFVLLLGFAALADGLRQLTDFFGQPRNGGWNTARSIAIAVGSFDDNLKLRNIRDVTVEGRRSWSRASWLNSGRFLRSPVCCRRNGVR